MKKIAVTSHVARDFLQNAAYFNTLPKVVWEYVSNSLDNAREGVPAIVVVDIVGHDRLTIADNGMGMSRAELGHFFTMHGENPLRKRGKKVRGRFGTGKAAAFGIARQLTIDTRQGGRRNVVRLRLSAIKQAVSGEPIPVEDLVVDESCDLDDGTLVEVSDFMIKRLELEPVISYVERHLARYRGKASVTINGHPCKFREPPSLHVREVSAPPEISRHIGVAKLIIKVSPMALEREERGVDILAEGIWHETTLGDVDGREYSDRLFGEIDVPLLEQVEDDIPVFDNTRNNMLNRANPRVVVLIGWVSQELEAVRQQIAAEEKQRRRSEQARRLAEEAARLAQVLNEDFSQLMMELDAARKMTKGAASRVEEEPGADGAVVPGDGDLLSEFQRGGQPHGHGARGNSPPGVGEVPREGPSLIPGEDPGRRMLARRYGPKRRSGFFSVEFANHTDTYPRSTYDRETNTIFVNLDHPQVAQALRDVGGNLDAKPFLSMVYEIAGVEYAQAIPFERLQRGEQVDGAEALFSVRETVDRITRRFAQILSEKH